MKNKTLIAVVTTVISAVVLAAVGVMFDRPALHSEVQEVAEQSIENKISILVINKTDVQHEIWELEDRIEDKGMTPERKQRLRELEVAFDNLTNLIDRFTPKQ